MFAIYLRVAELPCCSASKVGVDWRRWNFNTGVPMKMIVLLTALSFVSSTFAQNITNDKILPTQDNKVLAQVNKIIEVQPVAIKDAKGVWHFNPVPARIVLAMVRSPGHTDLCGCYTGTNDLVLSVVYQDETQTRGANYDLDFASLSLYSVKSVKDVKFNKKTNILTFVSTSEHDENRKIQLVEHKVDLSALAKEIMTPTDIVDDEPLKSEISISSKILSK